MTRNYQAGLLLLLATQAGSLADITPPRPSAKPSPQRAITYASAAAKTVKPVSSTAARPATMATNRATAATRASVTTSASSARTLPPGSLQRTLLARVTVYWASGGGKSDRWTRKHQAATSVRLRAGHCAVDPRHIPYGSRVCFPDSTLLAVDTGRHVVSRKAARLSGHTANEKNALVIDRFFETRRQAEAWANSHPPFMTVQILPPATRSTSTQPKQAQPTRLVAYNQRATGLTAPSGAVR